MAFPPPPKVREGSFDSWLWRWFKAQEAIGASAGDAATLLTKTWAAPAAIGSTTPASGAFTTLSASSTVSGAGFTSYFASPPTIGGTTPGAGNFTSVNIKGTAGAGFLTLVGQSSNPTPPAAGTLLLHSETTQGFTRLVQDTETGTNIILGRDNIIVCRNSTGSAIAAGSVVYVSGSTGNVPTVALAQANSASTMPALGLVLDQINNASFGQVMISGIEGSLNTSSYASGDQLYVSATVAGGLTNVRPSGTTNIVQMIGRVLVSGVGNGSIGVTVAPALLNVETGTNAPTWTATTVNATTVDTTNLEVTNLKARDGTAAGSIADSTGVVTLASSILTTADINGGTVDGATVGGASPAAGTFTSLNATGGGALTGTWTNLGTVTTVDINGGTVDGAPVGATTASTGKFTTLEATSLVDISGASAGQIKFPATANPSSNANTLDDYEEGTWTPVDASGAGLSFTAVGSYTKVGRVVTVHGSVVYPVTASGAGALIGGLPFTVNATYYGLGSCYTTGATALSALAVIATAAIAPFSAASAAQRTNAQMSETTLVFSLYYEV